MKIWIDAQLSPAMAQWIYKEFQVDAFALRDLGLREAKDYEIFNSARKQNAIVMTKDIDFIHLREQLGTPPQVIWLTCGNTSNQRLKQILSKTLPQALNMLKQGESLVEISDQW